MATIANGRTWTSGEQVTPAKLAVAPTLTPGTIEAADLADGAVATAKLADAAVTSAKMAAGAVVQVLQAVYDSYTSTTSTIPISSIPAITNGVQILSQTITPNSATNTVLVRAVVPLGNGSALQSILTLFRGSTFLNGVIAYGGAVGTQNTVVLEWLDSPASNTAQTYSVRFGTINAAGAATVNGYTVQNFGGVGGEKSTLTLMEIKA